MKRDALGGLFAVVARAAAATARKVYERLSYLSRLSLSLSLTFSLARISAVAVSKLFLRPVIKGWPAPPRANREIITRSITFRTDIFLPSESI